MASRGRLHWLEEHRERAGHARKPVTASTTQPRCDNAGAFLHNAVEPNLPQGLCTGNHKLTRQAFWIGLRQAAYFLHPSDHNGQALAYVYFEDEPGR